MLCLRHYWKQRDRGRNTWLLPHFRPSSSLQGLKLSRINGKGATEIQIAGLLGQLPVVPSRAGSGSKSKEAIDWNDPLRQGFQIPNV